MLTLRPFRTVLVLVCVSLGFAFATSVSASAANFEPNDTFLQATGPLGVGVDYDTTIETINDVDWFYFYTGGQTQISINFTHLAGSASISKDQLLLDDQMNVVARTWTTSSNPLKTISYTAPGAKKYYLKIEQNSGFAVRFQIPAGVNITPVPAPLPSQVTSCQANQKSARKFRAKVSSIKKRLKKTKSKSGRRSLKRRLRSTKKSLATSNSAVARDCSPAVLELLQNDPTYQ